MSVHLKPFPVLVGLLHQTLSWFLTELLEQKNIL